MPLTIEPEPNEITMTYLNSRYEQAIHFGREPDFGLVGHETYNDIVRIFLTMSKIRLEPKIGVPQLTFMGTRILLCPELGSREVIFVHRGRSD